MNLTNPANSPSHSSQPSTTTQFWSDWRFLAVIVLVGAAGRVLLTFLPSQFIGTDSAQYAIMGRNIMAGNGITLDGVTREWHFPPLFPALIGVSSLWFADLELAGRFVSFVLGTACIVLTYRLALLMFDRQVARYASVIAACYPFQMGISSSCYSEATYLFFFLLFCLLLWRSLEGSVLAACGAGASTGLAYLARGEAFAYLPLDLFLYGAAWYRSRQREVTSRWFGHILGYSLCFLVFASPYVGFLHAATGGWLVSGKTLDGSIYDHPDSVGYEAFHSLLPDGKTMQIEAYNREGLFAWLRKRPSFWVGKYLRNVDGFYCSLPEVFYPLVLMLVAVGVFGQSLTAKWLRSMGFMALLSLPALVYPLFLVSAHYLSPYVPFGIMLSAQGIQIIEEWWNTRMVARQLNRVPLGVLTVAFLLLTFIRSNGTVLRPRITGEVNPDVPLEHILAGRALRGKIGSQETVVSRNPWVAFYSNANFAVLPRASYQAVIRYCREMGFQWLVIDDRMIPETRPQLAFLIDPNEAPDTDLELRYEGKAGGHHIVVYRTKGRKDSRLQ